MGKAFALDLKVARRKSGLSQVDCAHLLGVHPTKISVLEHGKAMPSVPEICMLSLIYGKSFESLFGPVMAEAEARLRERLPTLPACPKKWLGRFNRQGTLNRLSERLAARSEPDHGDA